MERSWIYFLPRSSANLVCLLLLDATPCWATFHLLWLLLVQSITGLREKRKMKKKKKFDQREVCSKEKHKGKTWGSSSGWNSHNISLFPPEKKSSCSTASKMVKMRGIKLFFLSFSFSGEKKGEKLALVVMPAREPAQPAHPPWRQLQSLMTQIAQRERTLRRLRLYFFVVLLFTAVLIITTVAPPFFLTKFSFRVGKISEARGKLFFWPCVIIAFILRRPWATWDSLCLQNASGVSRQKQIARVIWVQLTRSPSYCEYPANFHDDEEEDFRATRLKILQY